MRNHCIALFVCICDVCGPQIHATFNKATYYGRGNYTNMTYQWYSLHFLLTNAIRLKKSTMLSNNKCRSTYRGTKTRYYVKGENIQFGSFTSSSLNRSVAQTFGNVSCFEIRTCHGAYISKYSNFTDQEEVLIPPYETFNVTAVLSRTAISSLWCDTVYVLNSTGIRSDLTCELVKQTNLSHNPRCGLVTSGQSLIYYRHESLMMASAFVFTVIYNNFIDMNMMMFNN